MAGTTDSPNLSLGEIADIPTIDAAGVAGRIDVPGDPDSLLRADFVRDGGDLVVVGPDGPMARIVGYFESASPADLALGGAVLPGRTIGILAGPDTSRDAPVMEARVEPMTNEERYAQEHGYSGDGAPRESSAFNTDIATAERDASQTDLDTPIAQVEDVVGDVWVIRFDGSRVQLEIGTPVLQDDIVVTGADGSLGLRFVDGMSFSLGNDARMVLEDFHYDAESGDGGGLLSVVQGAFSFVSGRAAKAHEDSLQIELPTMTIGVRGTKVAGFAAAEGETSRVALLAEDDGTVGKIMVSTDGGQYLITDANLMVESYSRAASPREPIELSSDAMHNYFSSALTILPSATPKPGNENRTSPTEGIDLNLGPADDGGSGFRTPRVDDVAPPAEKPATRTFQEAVTETRKAEAAEEAKAEEAAAEEAPAVTLAPAANDEAPAPVVTQDDEDDEAEVAAAEDDTPPPPPAPTPTNTAPVLDNSGAPALTAVAEDAGASGAMTVGALVVDGSITDADGAVAEAIAVTSVDDSNGTWQYSTDGGTTFAAIGPVSANSALLLDASAMVRFVPDADYNGTATFTYKAWDQSTGSNGDTGVDTTSGTAFSAASETASIVVTPVADAPVLDNSGTPNLTAIAEDAVSSAGDTVADIVVDGSISDADGAVAEAIAITGVDDTNGTWQYSTDGGTTFAAIGPVSASSALLLDASAMVRFVPDADYNGTASFTYKAWDQSTGSNGDNGVNTTIGDAFSFASETATLTVTPGADAPVLDISDTPTLTAIAQDSAAPTGDSVASIVTDGSISDVDGAVAEAIAVTGVDDANGTWEYSTDGGTTFASIGPVSDNAALLLDATALIRFVPDPGYNGTSTFTYKAWDQSAGSPGDTGVDTTLGTAFSVLAETASITIDPGNNAPVLDTSGTPVLTAIAEDAVAPAGDSVADIVTDGSMTDPDGAVAEAIAITGVDDTNGTWQYSTDGGATFAAIGPVSASSALLLDGTAQIRFVPDADYNGDATFAFKAWDQSTGASGATGVYTVGNSAFSAATETASVTVTAANDAPVLDTAGNPVLSAIAEDTTAPAGDTVSSIVVDGSITDIDGAVAVGIAVVGVDDANGTWEYSTDGGATFSAFGAVDPTSAYLLDGAAVIRFVPDADYNGTATFSYKAWDQSLGSSGEGPVDTTTGTLFSSAIESASITVVAQSETTDFTGGSEFLVNTTTANDQANPSIAALNDGGYVVVWDSNGQDGSNQGVFAQRYDASGTAIGGEIQVNTETANAQDDAMVVALADGGFAVVWTSMNQDGNNAGIFGQRYDASGNPAGAEFQVNTETFNMQENPDIAALDGGGFVVTWESQNQDGSATGVYGQRYDASGNPAGTEFLINSTTDNQQYNSRVVGTSDGGFVVVWQSQNQDADDRGVFAQRYDAAGVAQGAEFQVNTTETGAQDEPAVAALDSGFVVVWSSAGQDGSGSGVFAQRFDTSGNPVEFEFQVNTETNGDQGAATVVALSDGGFLVAWQSTGQDGAGEGIYAQRFNSDGDRVGAEFAINSTTANNEGDISLATLSTGSVVAAWESDAQDGDGAGIVGRQFDAAASSGNAAPVAAWTSMLDLDGSADYVDAGQAGGAHDPGTGDFTVEAWFYYDGSGGTQTVLSKGGTLLSDEGYRITIEDGTLVLRATSATLGGENYQAATQIDLAQPGWYHVGMVIDQEAGTNASSVTGYLNGSAAGWTNGYGSVSDNLFTTDSDGIDSGDSMLIGADQGLLATGDFFGGAIADVRLWDTARDAAEISNNLARQLEGDEDGLVANWHMDEGSGSTLANAVAGGSSATVNGGPTWASTTSYSMAQDGTLDGRVTANDADGDPLTFSVSGTASNGTASIDPTTGIWQYTPDSGYTGSDSFSYQITDGTDTDVVTVSVNVA